MRRPAGTGALARTLARTEARSLLAWALTLGVLAWYSVDALASTYATAELRLAGAVLASTPGVAAFTGPGLGLEAAARAGEGAAHAATLAPSLGALVADEVLLYLIVPAAVHALLTVTRHTRAAEDTGLAEVVRSGAVGRLTLPLTAAAVETCCQVIIGVAVSVGLLVSGLPAGGAVLAGGATAATGLAFAGLALAAGQLLPTARAVRGAGLLLLLAAFEVRAVGDVARVSDTPWGWVSLLSPLGWAQATGPWSTQQWGWLAPLLATAVLAGAGAVGLARGRDLGATALPLPQAPGAGRPGPRGLAALIARTHGGAVAAWCLGGIVVAGLYGSIAGSVESTLADMLTSSPYLEAFVGSSLTVRSFLQLVTQYLGYIAAGSAVALTLTAWSDERTGRAALIVASPCPRWRRLAVAAGAGAATSLAVVLLSGVTLAATTALTTGQADLAGACLLACLLSFPSCLLLAGLSALATGVGRAAGALSWTLFAAALLIAMLAAPLDLPGVVADLSPLTHVPDVLTGGTDVLTRSAPTAPGWLALVVLSALGAVAAWAGCVLVSRRDLGG